VQKALFEAEYESNDLAPKLKPSKEFKYIGE
jgi:hypothetical protein